MGLMEKKTVLSCKNLSFSYQKKKILKSISLDFHSREFVGLLGRNGAGKSTLLSCLCGLLPSDFEHLTIENFNLARLGRKGIARILSFVPQEHEDMFPFSVLDVVVMGRTVFLGSFGAPGKKDIKQAKEVLAELHISDLAHRVYTSLSGGEKQMVLLARALVQTRKIIFLDEPTNHLDYKNRYHMLAQLKGLRRDHGSCIVACLHDPNHALLFADRVILLHEGRILLEGKTREVLSCDAVSRLYGIAIRKDKDGGLENILPAFVHPAFKSRVLLLVGHSGEGKTTILQQAVTKKKGIRFGGVVCPGNFRNGQRYSSEIKCLHTGKSALFAKRTDTLGSSPFVFYSDGQDLADKALDADRNRETDCVVVDEVGPLELKGQGLAPLLAPLLSLEKPRHIWAVRPNIVNEVCRRWMLVDPVIVRVSELNALSRIHDFLINKGNAHA
jgi:iron complex transport system ATP-binding protein